MDLDTLSGLLLWSLAINYAVLVLWFVAYLSGRGWMHRIHGRLLRMDDATLDRIHVAGMAGYKLAILFFNLVPLCAVALVRG